MLSKLVAINDERISAGLTANVGVAMILYNPDGHELFRGSVHPNVQYEYETKTEGEYRLCVRLGDEAWEALGETGRNSYRKIKTDIKFSAEFHRSKSKQSNRVNLHSTPNLIHLCLHVSIDQNKKQQKTSKNSSDDGNFHVAAREAEYDSAVSKGAFDILTKRIKKIDNALDSIREYQKYEREQENLYKEYSASLASSIFNMTMIEIILVIASAAYSVWSLRSFFVKKHIQ